MHSQRERSHWQRNTKGGEAQTEDTRQRNLFSFTIDHIFQRHYTDCLRQGAAGNDQSWTSAWLHVEDGKHAKLQPEQNTPSGTGGHREAWAATNTHKHTMRSWPQGSDTEVKSPGKVHPTFLDSVMMASCFGCSQYWQTVQYEQRLETLGARLSQQWTSVLWPPLTAGTCGNRLQRDQDFLGRLHNNLHMAASLTQSAINLQLLVNMTSRSCITPTPKLRVLAKLLWPSGF